VPDLRLDVVLRAAADNPPITMQRDHPFGPATPDGLTTPLARTGCIQAVTVRGERARRKPRPKPTFTVLVSDEAIGRCLEWFFGDELGGRYDLRFRRFGSFQHLLALAEGGGFDAAAVYINGAFWRPGDQGWQDYVERGIPALVAFRRRFRRPVLAYQGLDLKGRFEGTGVTFLMCPPETAELRRIIRLQLGA